MYAQVEKPKENKCGVVANFVTQKKSNVKQSFGFVDKRHEGYTQATLQRKANYAGLLDNSLIETSANKSLNDTLKNTGAVQRILGEPRGSASSAIKKGVELYVSGLNNAVERAYDLLVSLAFLKIAPVDGYMQRFLQDWVLWNTSNGKPNGMLPDNEVGLMFARAGYWIESFATLVLKPSVPEGLTVAFQVPMGSTRPDVVLYQGDSVVALLDITATGSVGHIDAKSSAIWNGKDGVYVNEIMYPSIDFLSMRTNHQKGLFPNSDKDIEGLIGEYNKSKNAERIRHSDFMAIIGEIGQTVQEYSSPLPSSRRGERKDLMRDAIRLHFGTKYTPAQIGSILTYGGISRETYGLVSGNASAQEGAFLLKDKSPGGNFGNGRDAVLMVLSAGKGGESKEVKEDGDEEETDDK